MDPTHKFLAWDNGPDGSGFMIRCTCGWHTPLYKSYGDALLAMYEHLRPGAFPVQ